VAYAANSPKKGKTMRNLLLAAMLLVCNPAFALSPNEVRENYPMITQSACLDSETGQLGHCFMFDRGDGTFYMVFTQHGEPVFVRQTLKDGGYITVWRFGEVTA